MVEHKDTLEIAPEFELAPDEMVLNMGPQHPSTHGVLRLILKTDGEVVKAVKPVIGYLHRCAEKCAEALAYYQFVPYTDRLDYLASMNNNWGYCLAVEKLLNIKVPERAEYIRVIMAELNRIASHLVAFGTFGLDMGAWTPILYAFREREKILDIFERACGARLTYNYYTIGGVWNDLDKTTIDMIIDFCNYFEPKIDEYDNLLSYNEIFIKRTANIGILPAELAINYGVSGPCLRGSGVKYDIRKNDPYGVYDRFDFEIPIGTGEKGTVGDSWDRYMVRIREMRECIKIIRQAVAQLPDGDIQAPVRVIRPPKGEVYSRTENPKGELGYYLISQGTDKPYRLKIRAPSFSNLSVLPEICQNHLIADIIAILGSIDIVLGEVDR
jgi:NADH-quinone oxidoreductase subunit D